MIAEQEFQKLQELRTRVDMLISYYRGFGELERTFVQFLEHRQSRLATELESDAYRSGAEGLHG